MISSVSPAVVLNPGFSSLNFQRKWMNSSVIMGKWFRISSLNPEKGKKVMQEH
jgi:hypothetical protein